MKQRIKYFTIYTFTKFTNYFLYKLSATFRLISMRINFEKLKKQREIHTDAAQKLENLRRIF